MNTLIPDTIFPAFKSGKTYVHKVKDLTNYMSYDYVQVGDMYFVNSGPFEEKVKVKVRGRKKGTWKQKMVRKVVGIKFIHKGILYKQPITIEVRYL